MASADHRWPTPAVVLTGALVIAWALALIIGSGTPQIRAVERSEGGSATGFDKVLHFAAFFLLAVLLDCFYTALFRSKSPRFTALLVAFTSTGYAVVHEASQVLVPGEVANPYDLLADFFGILTALGIMTLWRRASTAGSRSFPPAG